MAMRWSRAALLAVVMLGIAVPAQAICAWVGGPCTTFWSYDAVFDGTVVSVEQKPAPREGPDSVPYRLVTFQVHRSWRGDPGPRIQLRSPGGPNLVLSESIDFVVHRRYLVFAHRLPGGDMLTSGCDPTDPIPSKNASDTLAFLDSLATPATGGDVRVHVSMAAGRTPADATVVLEGNGLRRVGQTRGGEYAFLDVPPGTYRVTLGTPDGHAGVEPERVVVEHPHQCQWAMFVLR